MLLSANILTIIGTMKYFLCVCLYISLSFSAHAAEEGDSETATPDTASSAAKPSAPAVPRTEPNADANRVSSLLKSYMPDTEILQLDTGTEDEKLVAYYQSPGAPVIQGGILILPDQTTSPDQPDDLTYLRKGLSDYGWHTLSLLLPTPERHDLPKRTLPVLTAIKPTSTKEGEEDQAPADEPKEEAPEELNPMDETPSTDDKDASPTEGSENSEDKADDKPAEPYSEILTRYALAGTKHLQEQGAERLIITGFGTGAVWAAQFVEQNQANLDLRLVMVDARQPDTPESPELLTILPKIEETIIDLYHSPRSSHLEHEQLHSATKRLKIARNKRMNNFHQSRLPATHDNWKKDNNWTLKQIRGLINTYIIKAEESQRDLKLDDPKKSGEKAPGTGA